MQQSIMRLSNSKACYKDVLLYEGCFHVGYSNPFHTPYVGRITLRYWEPIHIFYTCLLQILKLCFMDHQKYQNYDYDNMLIFLRFFQLLTISVYSIFCC